MDSVIKADLFRYFGKNDVKTFLRSWFIPGFRFTYFLRKTAGHPKHSPMGLFYRYFLRRYRIKYGIHIAAQTQIGRGLHIYHNGGIVINPEVSIGENCSLGSNITIGQANRGSRKGNPTMGNRVFVGSGAVVVGKVLIGDNVLIAPNAFVNFDVPSDSLVIGNPAKIIPDANATLDYVVNLAGREADLVQAKPDAATVLIGVGKEMPL
jgi:serine O-acetyltransferase